MTGPRDVFWLVQSNLGSTRAIEDLSAAFAALGQPHALVTAIPFSDELPEVEVRSPVVAYGATGWITRIATSGVFAPGAFFDLEAFRVSAWAPRYGERFVNAGAAFTTLGELSAQSRGEDDLLFLRPDRDLKAFAGEVVRFGDVRAWCARLRDGELALGPDEPVVVAEPQRIRQEWRVFVCDGVAVAASRYRVDFRLAPDADTPLEVLRFAEECAGIHAPAPVFVLDIAEVAAGLRVIEVNCLHSAGFYEADVRAIVEGVSQATARWIDRRAT